MIPQYVDENYGYVDEAHRDYRKLVEGIFPDFSGYVDWFVVEALGAISHYAIAK